MNKKMLIRATALRFRPKACRDRAAKETQQERLKVLPLVSQKYFLVPTKNGNRKPKMAEMRCGKYDRILKG